MPLAISEKRYQQIKAGVEQCRLAAKVKAIISEPGEMTFASVDAFMTYMDTYVEPATDDPLKPLGKR